MVRPALPHVAYVMTARAMSVHAARGQVALHENCWVCAGIADDVYAAGLLIAYMVGVLSSAQRMQDEKRLLYGVPLCQDQSSSNIQVVHMHRHLCHSASLAALMAQQYRRVCTAFQYTLPTNAMAPACAAVTFP